jgi:hypothetical protein
MLSQPSLKLRAFFYLRMELDTVKSQLVVANSRHYIPRLSDHAKVLRCLFDAVTVCQQNWLFFGKTSANIQ